MLTEEEKNEIKEMAASATLREEFRTLRRNSRTREGNISVDDLMRWLTAMAQICPQPESRDLLSTTRMRRFEMLFFALFSLLDVVLNVLDCLGA